MWHSMETIADANFFDINKLNLFARAKPILEKYGLIVSREGKIEVSTWYVNDFTAAYRDSMPPAELESERHAKFAELRYKLFKLSS